MADPGPGVDAFGRTAIDPTQNVLDLVAAEARRQDDLREAEARRLDGNAALRAYYDELLRQAESRRIDANRSADVAVVTRAVEVSAQSAAALATSVTASADAMRAQVSATATAASTALTNVIGPLAQDIADLRKTQSEQRGEKSAEGEQQTNRVDTRTLVLGLLGLGIAALAVIVPVATAIIVVAVTTHGKF